MTRHLVALLAITLLVVGCSRKRPPRPVPTAPEPPAVAPQPDDGSIPPPRPVVAVEKTLARGVAYLLKAQSADGSWRSDVYATFKDGTALTPLAVIALQDALDAGADDPAIPTAIRKGCEFLKKFVTPAGIDAGPTGFDYPLYTAALTIRAYSHGGSSEFLPARAAWVKYLKERQLTEKLGWKPADKQFGGWGYCRVIPKKPEPNVIAPPLIESNLSAAVYALEALHAAGELDADTAKTAAAFVRRCQNTDGGFHFIYDDPTRNKAGLASTDPAKFHSYGSTTADGLRALDLCGLAEDKDRREAARNWLATNFRADTHPGTYVAAHEVNREAVYYYYAASLSQAVRAEGLTLVERRNWAAELATELLRRQNPDGSWANPVELVRENDPIVATCNAVSALARCKR